MLGYCFTPYQRLWLYNAAPLVAFYDTLGIRRTYSRLKPRRPHGGRKDQMAAGQDHETRKQKLAILCLKLQLVEGIPIAYLL